MSVKLIAFGGSLRKDSYNKKLARVAADFARAAGAEVTEIDLKQWQLPIYDGDLEDAEGIPKKALELRELMKSHDGYIISSPEYNSSISAVLKNTIDWASRPREGEPGLVCFKGKTAALFAASPGALGGLRGLNSVRSILGNIGVFLVPDQFALSKANEAFDEAGGLKDQKQAATVRGIAEKLVTLTRGLKGQG